MKKVLIISWTFPPATGTTRPMGLTKYLPDFGWEPIVLTPRIPGTRPPGVRIIETELRTIEMDLKRFMRRKSEQQPTQGQVSPPETATEGKRHSIQMILRLISIFSHFFVYPDNYITWYKEAVSKVKQFIENEGVDAILATSPPYTSQLIALTLKQMFDIPWIADFRDLYSQEPDYPRGRMRHFMEEKLEIQTLKQADCLVTISQPLAQKLRTLHRRHVETIENGFDLDDFNLVKRQCELQNDKLTITYAGTFYYPYQDIGLLFGAISELIKEKKIEKSKICVNFYGKVANQGKIDTCILNELISQYELQDVVIYHGFVERKKVLQAEVDSDLLLLLCWTDPTEEGVNPGKGFEYLGAGRPILAVGGVSKQTMVEIINQTRAGVHCSCVDDVKRELFKYYKEWSLKGNISYRGIDEEISKYSHRAMAGKFAKLLNLTADRCK